MTNLNFESYFEDENNRYYDSKYIIIILEEILGKTLDNIKNDINSSQVMVTKEQITEFLEKKFEEEDPELKRRIEKPKQKRSSSLIKLTELDIKAASQEFVDGLSATRYYFSPYTLEYFNKYSTIVRNKAISLLNIIEKIGQGESNSIQDLITNLDIKLDANGNILKEDIIRLITPTVYNIDELNEKVTTANNLSTYLTFKMSIDSLYRNGLSEGEVYPTESIQIKSLGYDHIQGNIPLSNNQREELKEEQRKSMQQGAKLLLSLFD